MRKINWLLLMVFTFWSFTLQGQIFSTSTVEYKLEEKEAKPWALGFYLGYNFLQYSIEANPSVSLIDEPSVESKSNGGFNIGLMVKKRVTDHFDIRFEPGAVLVDRTITFTKLDPLINSKKERKKPSTFVYLPLIFDFHGNRYKNTRPYIAAGVSYWHNLQSQQKSTNDNQNGTFRTTTSNFAAEGELGVNIYFEKFKLTPFVKGVLFLNNELVKDNVGTIQQAETVKDIRTNGIMLGLKFE